MPVVYPHRWYNDGVRQLKASVVNYDSGEECRMSWRSEQLEWVEWRGRVAIFVLGAFFAYVAVRLCLS